MLCSSELSGVGLCNPDQPARATMLQSDRNQYDNLIHVLPLLQIGLLMHYAVKTQENSSKNVFARLHDLSYLWNIQQLFKCPSRRHNPWDESPTFEGGRLVLRTFSKATGIMKICQRINSIRDFGFIILNAVTDWEPWSTHINEQKIKSVSAAV